MEKPELYSKGTSTITINKNALDKFGDHIRWNKDPLSIFEAGIGDGRVTKEVIIPILPENVEEYVGSDLSKTMLEFSKTIIDYPKYQTLHMDICATEVPIEYHNKFDKVFAFCLLHMVSSNLR